MINLFYVYILICTTSEESIEWDQGLLDAKGYLFIIPLSFESGYIL